MSLRYDVVYRLALKLLGRLREFDGATLVAFRSDGCIEKHEIGATLPVMVELDADRYER